MQINVKNVFLYDGDSFKTNNIDDKKYELIRYCSLKERQICGNIKYDKSQFLYKKSLELIESYETFFSRTASFTSDMNSLPSTSHRNKLSFDSSLQKQIFINNFIFPENENFINSLITCNISKDSILELKSEIERKKQISKIDKNYILNIDHFNIKELCSFYGCKYPTLIINKLLELYYKNPELFNNLEKKR